MKILFCLFLLIISLPLFSLNADDYWSNWHGPANGTACFTSGAPGASIVLSKTLDLTSLYGFSGLGSGILLRADNKTLYLKENRDYFAAPHILRGIDPYSGNTLWSSGKSALEDMSNPRGFQLFNDPRGHLSLHVPVYYEGYWNVYNLKTSAEEYLVSGSHACLGSRIIMDKWAWRNTQTTSTGGGMTWSHTGRLQYWNGAQYINTTLDPFQLIDHAWDNGRAVIFALKGYSYGALNASDTNAKEWQSARFMVLDSSGKVLSDTPVTDIHVPVSGCCCYFEGSMGGTADTADILMKLAVHGDYVYAIEHSTYEEKQLVRRSISGGFRKTDSIILGTDPLLSNLSYSISGNTLFLQGTDTLTAFSLDFKTIKWKQAIPHRTLYHIFVQGLTRVMSNGLKNRNLHSLATDANNVYSVSDSFLIVFNNSDGTELLRHRFTDIPNGGTAGSIILMPDFVAV
ncbi:MAG: hypothetical protein JNL74_15915, partial [Fibrobacteres bacterium]|nr:hypothetical protein [Fibrobacterota bacterium]